MQVRQKRRLVRLHGLRGQLLGALALPCPAVDGGPLVEETGGRRRLILTEKAVQPLQRRRQTRRILLACRRAQATESRMGSGVGAGQGPAESVVGGVVLLQLVLVQLAEGHQRLAARIAVEDLGQLLGRFRLVGRVAEARQRPSQAPQRRRMSRALVEEVAIGLRRVREAAPLPLVHVAKLQQHRDHALVAAASPRPRA